GATELDGPVQHADRVACVTRLAPNAPAREPHGAEAETVDEQLAAQEEGPAPGGGTCFNAGVAGALRTKGRHHVCPNTRETSLVPREESLELPRRRHTSGHPAPATPFAASRSHEARRVHTHRTGDGGGDHRSSGRDRDSEVDQPERTGAARRDEVRFAES